MCLAEIPIPATFVNQLQSCLPSMYTNYNAFSVWYNHTPRETHQGKQTYSSEPSQIRSRYVWVLTVGQAARFNKIYTTQFNTDVEDLEGYLAAGNYQALHWTCQVWLEHLSFDATMRVCIEGLDSVLESREDNQANVALPARTYSTVYTLAF